MNTTNTGANLFSSRMRLVGFTLIEVLVVVAIIALLIAILVPSLTKARDQAKRAVCTNNLHQQLLAMHSYAHDNKGFLPWRGWFTYSLSEVPREAYGWGGESTKTRVNLALLIGKHLSKNWDVIYCPSTINRFRDSPTGLRTLNNPSVRFSHGGYNYALPMAARGGSDGSGKSLLACARVDIPVYPHDVRMLDSRWLTVLKDKSVAAGIPLVNNQPDLRRMMPRRLQPIVMDFVMGTATGNDHRGGLNVAYNDGHARFVRHNEMVEGGGLNNAEVFEVWYDMTVRP